MKESSSAVNKESGRVATHRTQANRTGWIRWVPGFSTLRRYESAWLRYDLVAGLVMTTMLVPVGIAYAEASGLPGINGLYATIVPLIAYAVFGPSRILVLGPDSALAALILTVVVPLSAGKPQRAVALAGMMAIISGLLCVVAGLARLGFITELLSKPIRYGYMNGIALTVLLSQVPKLFGFSVTANGPLRQTWGILEKVLTGSTNVVTLAIGVSTLALILSLILRNPIAVIAATVAVVAFNLETVGCLFSVVRPGLPCRAFPCPSMILRPC
jgi:MFS superfamily sulfate permease-like transporter